MRHHTPLSRRGGAAGLAALIAAAAGCSDGAGPTDSPLAGQVFALTSVGGAGLPAVMSAYGGDTTFIVGDTLRFLPGGKVARGMWLLHRGVHGKSADSSRWTPDYRVTGARIEIGFFTPCPPTALCAANDVGAVWADRLLLTVDMSPPPPGRTYRRLGRA